ncbi:hypothetical protein T492DRAFT_988840 [Pavlovales sp. CCMP2436]|nr:hypothetical protein T492DRAFT_988840 [Pavlovales sp. CCMP2436]
MNAIDLAAVLFALLAPGASSRTALRVGFHCSLGSPQRFGGGDSHRFGSTFRPASSLPSRSAASVDSGDGSGNGSGDDSGKGKGEGEGEGSMLLASGLMSTEWKKLSLQQVLVKVATSAYTWLSLACWKVMSIVCKVVELSPTQMFALLFVVTVSGFAFVLRELRDQSAHFNSRTSTTSAPKSPRIPLGFPSWT